ncbi:unnamed protein product [Eruca vesicaria subsp. sativa]|uniref:Transmembrane protein n=1 Tax=Eruca vesicaria subsp. sativa TaxID=29727 RepID=A0ABC8JF20_ERUVS|nr:unnamed protein product [Eruca vesicaria subsp. sativa]
MGKFSPKSAFIVLLAFTVMISVTHQIVEAKRMLHEEKSLPLLDLQVSKLVNPQMVGFSKHVKKASRGRPLKIRKLGNIPSGSGTFWSPYIDRPFEVFGNRFYDRCINNIFVTVIKDLKEGIQSFFET